VAGRPSSYTSEFAELILSELAEGKSLKRICLEHEGLPSPKTVREWVAKNIDGFRDKYAIAKEEMLEAWADDLVEIADESKHDTVQTETGDHPDNEWINRSRLRVDTRKWVMSKLLPKRYGDKIAVGGAEDLGPVQLSWKLRSTTPPETKP
jgi:hypothetical protein